MKTKSTLTEKELRTIWESGDGSARELADAAATRALEERSRKLYHDKIGDTTFTRAMLVELRDVQMTMRDAAINQGKFGIAVPMSLIVAFLGCVIEDMPEDEPANPREREDELARHVEVLEPRRDTFDDFRRPGDTGT